MKDVSLIRIGHLKLNFGGTHDGPANFMPFKTIRLYLSGENGWLISGINILGNIFILVPIGFLSSLLISSISRKQVVVIACSLSLCIESLQAIGHIGIFDIDDVILNGLGVWLGHEFWKILPSNIHWDRFLSFSILSISVLLVYYLIASNFRWPLPIGFEPMTQIETNDASRNYVSTNDDLCGGTGGTGCIIKLDPTKHQFLIQRKDGVIELIHINEKTIINSPRGVIHETDLREGNRVTLVVGEGRLASLILICR